MGDVVLLVDVLEPRSAWPIGLVVDVKTGRDGNVRTVMLDVKGNFSFDLSLRLCILRVIYIVESSSFNGGMLITYSRLLLLSDQHNMFIYFVTRE